MPRLPGWAWLLLAIAFATLATYMAMGYIKNRVAKPAYKQQIYVVRAKTKVEKEKILSSAQLTRSEWNEQKPPQDYFSEETEVVGLQTVKPLAPNEMITRENTRKYIPGLAGKVGKDVRAITVKVDEASGVAGFLTPGNRVDVLVVLDRGEFNKNPLSKTLFQNLKVLGTGQKKENIPGEDKAQIVPTVTLEVTPEQGEILALAMQQGRISLALRGQLLQEPPGEDAGTSKPAVPGTTTLLSPNQRVVPIMVSDASAVAPGKRVDVVLFMNKNEWSKYPIAKILFQNIEVLNTDKRQQVTLAVTPQEAVDLTWAAQVGHISLLVRPDDKTFDKNGAVVWTSARQILGNAGELRPPRTVEVLRGVEMGAEVPLTNKNRQPYVPTTAVRR
jgi:pilus assembly protein CpaB